jgi:hypothetical protein
MYQGAYGENEIIAIVTFSFARAVLVVNKSCVSSSTAATPKLDKNLLERELVIAMNILLVNVSF